MNLSRGDVLYDIGFIYPGDTTPCDKLLLIVNKNYKDPQDVVFIPCTTHKDDHQYKTGCNEIEKVFYFNDKIGFYDSKTILQIYLIDSMTIDTLNNLVNTGRIKQAKGKNTTTEEINRIINCLKNLKDDIAWYIQDLIF